MSTNNLETPLTTTQPEISATPTTTASEPNPESIPGPASEPDIDQAAITSIRKNLAAIPSTPPTEGDTPNPNIKHEISPTLPIAETGATTNQESKPKTGLKALIFGLFSKKQAPPPTQTPENITNFEAKKDQIQNPNLPTNNTTGEVLEKAA